MSCNPQQHQAHLQQQAHAVLLCVALLALALTLACLLAVVLWRHGPANATAVLLVLSWGTRLVRAEGA